MAKKRLITFLIALMSLPLVTMETVYADDIYSDGKVGEARRVPKDNEFKVCADSNNLPYSNDKGEGFENKIAELLAKEMGKELSYQFWFDRFGFLRNTLNAYRCDYLIGTTTTYDAVDTTKPYYRAGYVWVYRKDRGLNIKDWKSEDLRKSVIGIKDKSPVTVALDDNDLMGNAKPYRIQRDLTASPGELIDDVVSGEVDIAVEWGPLAGYYAKQSGVEMMIVPIPEYEQVKQTGKTLWNISVGVRKRDVERRDEVEAVVMKNRDKILKILDDYGIPYLEPEFSSNLDGYKRHKQ
ncbi:MAG: quinoprotein dehydrogenase-associated putative ABC transporter substrate-binding protein [Methylophilaceae bacterium]